MDNHFQLPFQQHHALLTDNQSKLRSVKLRSVKGTKKKTNKHKRQKTRPKEAEEDNKDDDNGEGNHNDNDNSRANSGVGGPVNEDESSLGMNDDNKESTDETEDDT